MSNNDEMIVNKMIDFVEEKEKEIQAAKMGKNSKAKAVTEILKELERQIKDADKKC